MSGGLDCCGSGGDGGIFRRQNARCGQDVLRIFVE